VKRLTTLFALLLCTVLPAQTVRSLGAADDDFWKDFSKLYTEFLGKSKAEEDLLKLKSIYDDPAWEPRGDFQALARELLRKRIVEPETWAESVQLALAWYGAASESAQKRWWAETAELTKRSSRLAMVEYLHTAAGAAAGFQTPAGGSACLRRVRLNGSWNLAMRSSTKTPRTPATASRARS